jgi:hypothetical protein
MTWLHSILGELDQVYFGNTLAEWLRAAATFLIVCWCSAISAG